MKILLRLEKFYKYIAIAFVLIVAAFLACDFIPFYFAFTTVTDDPSDYLKITGNYDNDGPKTAIYSFFPERIEESFTDVTYHYKALTGGDWAYECYLEFAIEDPETYAHIKKQYVEETACTPFPYDQDFQEQRIEEYLTILRPAENAGEYTFEGGVGSILFSDDQQRMIFVSIGSNDGLTNMNEFDFFFSRFDIDLLDYWCDEVSAIISE